MDLRQLQQFVAVAEELHFGRAAERLGMTQPPLSQAILRLESEIGLKLFERSKRSVALTPGGRQWLEHVYRLLADADRLVSTARTLSEGRTGTLHLSFVSISSFRFLPELLRNYKEKYPRVDLVLREATSDVQIADIVNRACDVGIVVLSSQLGSNDGIRWARITREPLMAAIPTRLIEDGAIELVGGKIDISQLSQFSVVTVPRHTAPALYDNIAEYYHRNGIRPRIVQEANQMQTVVSLVSAGIGVAIVPEALRNFRREGVSYVDLAHDPPMIETALIWRNDPVGPVVRSFIDAALAFSERLRR
jgi:DNA-binding transcriptional LysR family regulator